MRNLLIVQIITLAVFIPVNSLSSVKDERIPVLYKECRLETKLPFSVFSLAMKGEEKISEIENRKVITIIDYSRPSTQERFFVIDLENKTVLYHSLVAHGRNSGENSADSFSDKSESLKSCLGFFRVAETYNGKHGYSLKLDGLEPGINGNARSRTIVIHGADYVSESFIKEHGRLGRSWGCPALPSGSARTIIDHIPKGSCLFIYGNDPGYLKVSKILNK